ncbi:phosphoribosyl-AMP cyclohydrolase [Arthrobacter sp. TE12232]
MDPQASGLPGGTRLDLMSEQPAPANAVPGDAVDTDAVVSGDAASNAAPSAPDSAASPLPAGLADALKRDSAGLVAAIVQQFDTHEVLMLGWMDDEALHRTMTSGRVTFYSRSRQEYWRKGDTSGHVQWVKSLAMDCDGDALLVRVDQVGAACHTGTRTCFDGREIDAVVGHGG